MFRELLGFDLWLRPERYLERAWQSERREHFLLRPDVFWPKSADTMVWPSMFAPANAWPDAAAEFDCVELEAEGFRWQCLRLWPDLATMLGNLRAHAPGMEKGGVPLRIELITEQPAERFDAWEAVLEPRLDCDKPPADWTLLGHDVADAAYISGLSNCGYLPEERK